MLVHCTVCFHIWLKGAKVSSLSVCVQISFLSKSAGNSLMWPQSVPVCTVHTHAAVVACALGIELVGRQVDWCTYMPSKYFTLSAHHLAEPSTTWAVIVHQYVLLLIVGTYCDWQEGTCGNQGPWHHSPYLSAGAHADWHQSCGQLGTHRERAERADHWRQTDWVRITKLW